MTCFEREVSKGLISFNYCVQPMDISVSCKVKELGGFESAKFKLKISAFRILQNFCIFYIILDEATVNFLLKLEFMYT